MGGGGVVCFLCPEHLQYLYRSIALIRLTVIFLTGPLGVPMWALWALV